MYLVILLEYQSIDESHLFHKEADRDKKAIEMANEQFGNENIEFKTLKDIADFQATEKFLDQCYDTKIIFDELNDIK